MAARRVRSVAEISARIFGNVVKPPGMRSPTRYTKQLWRGQNRLDYWNDAPDRTYTLRRTLRALGITKDESRDWRESQLVAYKERGKVLTQKGEGKRSKKAAKKGGPPKKA